MFSPVLAELIEAFGQLPSVGPKTAQRFAFYLLKQPQEATDRLATALKEAKAQMKACSQCHHWSSQDPCELCQNPKRNPQLLCVVEGPQDVYALERTHQFSGRYHVLGGLLSPLDGIGPSQLNVQTLLHRLPTQPAERAAMEVILALPPSTEGDTTSLYLHGVLQPLGVQVSRIAYGLPVGGDLDYADQLTLSRALEGRRLL
jgi:recombination protein RecR